MARLLHFLRSCAAAALLFAACAWAAPPVSAPEDPIAYLQSEYARAVQPGAQADAHRELLATVLRRVQRSHTAGADLDALAAAAAQALAPLPAGAGEPAEVFRKERAGLRAGDLIVQVDGQTLQGVALSDAVTRMRGEVGTQVALTVQRAGAEAFELSLKRDTIRRHLLRWHMEGDALVRRLASFSGPVSAALADAVDEATAAHTPRGVVLDLRGNPGGLLREAIRVADAFLAEGEIASMRGRTPATQRTWQADPAQLLPGVPLVVLIDRRSATASELVAAALQGHGRAGARGFGLRAARRAVALRRRRGPFARGGQRAGVRARLSGCGQRDCLHGGVRRSTALSGVDRIGCPAALSAASAAPAAAGARRDPAGARAGCGAGAAAAPARPCTRP